MNINNFLEKLGGVKKTNSGWIARCPAHEDNNPSLSVSEGDEGRILFHCHAGCSFASVLNSLDLTAKDLFNRVQPSLKTSSQGQEVARYTYTDEEGQPLFQVRRYLPKTFNLFRFESGQWISGIKGVRRVLYNLPAVIGSQTICVGEGEKDAETLKSLGFQATTCPMGAGKWLDEYSTYLENKTVIIFPDQDARGQEHAFDVASKLWDIAKVIKIVNIPEGKDLTEWVEKGGTKQSLELLMSETPAISSPPNCPKVYSEDVSASCVELVQGSDIKLEPIAWLWEGWLAQGKMHILAGAPGTGKTTIALALAATITLGGRWPDGKQAEPGNILIWSGEDDPGDTLAPRLIASGTDMNRVYFIGGVLKQGKKRPFDPALDLDALHEKISQIDGKISLLIVDPIVSVVMADSHKNAETRRALQPLADLGASLRCAILGITHFTKNSAGREPIDRLIGSVAFGALARIVMVAVKQQSIEGQTGSPSRMLIRSKSNIGVDDGGFKYDFRIEELPNYPGVTASSVLWKGIVQGSARDLLATAESFNTEKTATEEAIEFLKEILSSGPQKASEIFKEVRQAGISEKVIRTAKDRICKKPYKKEYAGGWWWELKADQDAQFTEDAPSDKLGILERNGHLRQNEILQKEIVPWIAQGPVHLDEVIGPLKSGKSKLKKVGRLYESI